MTFHILANKNFQKKAVQLQMFNIILRHETLSQKYKYICSRRVASLLVLNFLSLASVVKKNSLFYSFKFQYFSPILQHSLEKTIIHKAARSKPYILALQ